MLNQHYSVIIVGGGINGVGIARDCALRGLSCALIEKNDFSAGTSGASSGMIHGGLRYLLNDTRVTKLSCLDSGFIQKIAPHLLFRIPFLYTVYESKQLSGVFARLKLEAVEAFLKAYDSFSHLKNAKPHTRLSPQEILELEPRLLAHGLVGGVSFDEWGIDVPRLCVANMVDAKEHGCELFNHTQVVEVLKENNVVQGVVIKNLLDNTVQTLFCDVLINATGPWSTDFARLFGADVPLRLTKGIHVSFERRLSNVALVTQAIDGREVFLLPYQNETILGTTDDDFFDNLDEQRVTRDEVGYLTEAMTRIFPSLSSQRMLRAWSGVRPTLFSRGCYEDDLSREHEIIDHEKTKEAVGAFSITGGKLASYRIMSQEIVDRVAKRLGVKKKCQTHELPLPGGADVPAVSALVHDYALDPYVVSRLVYRHGSRAIRILDQIKDHPEQGALLCTCEPVTLAEALYVWEHEGAQTLSDLRRRTRLSLGPCLGTHCLSGSAALVAEKTRQNFDALLKDFLEEWQPNTEVVLGGDSKKQHEIFKAIYGKV